MTDDRIKLPYLDEIGLDGKRIYNYRQGLDRFKQYTKRKYEIDIRPLSKEETMAGTNEWSTKEEKIQQDFLWALRPKATHQITKSDYRTDPDNIKIDKLKKNYITDIIYRKETNKNQEEISFGQNKKVRRHRQTTERNYSN